MQTLMRTRSVQLVSAIPATDLWENMTPWLSTVGVLDVRGVLVLADKLNSFRVRIGIQTAVSDIEVPDAPINIPTTGALGTGYVTTVSKNVFDFDPTVSSNGNIATKAYFRVGLLYSSGDTNVSRGDVTLRVGYRT
jgi:hypothetical protein